jgi:hypothetical protein
VQANSSSDSGSISRESEARAELIGVVTASLEEYIASPLSPISWCDNTIDCESIVKFVLLAYAIVGGDV